MGHKRSQSGATAFVEQRLLAPAARRPRAAQPQGPGAVNGPAEVEGEREVRTQGRRPVCGVRRRGREAGVGAADAAAEPGTAPPSLSARAQAPPPSPACRARVGEGAEDGAPALRLRGRRRNGGGCQAACFARAVFFF